LSNLYFTNNFTNNMKVAHRAIPRRGALRSRAACPPAVNVGLNAKTAWWVSVCKFSKAACARESESALKHTPFGERGTVFYTDATRGCFDVLARLEKPVLAAVCPEPADCGT